MPDDTPDPVEVAKLAEHLKALAADYDRCERRSFVIQLEIDARAEGGTLGLDEYGMLPEPKETTHA